MAHIRLAKMRPNGSSGDIRMVLIDEVWVGDLPDVRPPSLCENIRAGNLKKMKMYIDPSKTQDVRLSDKIRLSGHD